MAEADRPFEVPGDAQTLLVLLDPDGEGCPRGKFGEDVEGLVIGPVVADDDLIRVPCLGKIRILAARAETVVRCKSQGQWRTSCSSHLECAENLFVCAGFERMKALFLQPGLESLVPVLLGGFLVLDAKVGLRQVEVFRG